MDPTKHRKHQPQLVNIVTCTNAVRAHSLMVTSRFNSDNDRTSQLLGKANLGLKVDDLSRPEKGHAER